VNRREKDRKNTYKIGRFSAPPMQSQKIIAEFLANQGIRNLLILYLFAECSFTKVKETG
jgi:hypothetical protein